VVADYRWTEDEWTETAAGGPPVDRLSAMNLNGTSFWIWKPDTLDSGADSGQVEKEEKEKETRRIRKRETFLVKA